VSRWNDKLGSGVDLLQSTSAAKPLYTANGVVFVSASSTSGKSMKTSIIALAQPNFVYCVFRIDKWNSWDQIFFAGTSLVYCRQGGTSSAPKLLFWVGGNFVGGAYVIGNYLILRLSLNGTSSFSRINTSATIAHSFGTDGLNGFTVGSKWDGYYPSDITLCEAIVRKKTDNDAEQNYIYNYLAKKYLLTEEDGGGVYSHATPGTIYTL